MNVKTQFSTGQTTDEVYEMILSRIVVIGTPDSFVVMNNDFSELPKYIQTKVQLVPLYVQM